MDKRKFSTALLMISLLVVASTAVFPVNATAIWKDISPNAYLSPPANPPLDSVYMFPADSPVEGWAVGDGPPTDNLTTALPSIFHYDGSGWTLVPAPKFPDFPATQCVYNLNSVNFGPPLHYISKNDGWAVGGLGVNPQSPACFPTAGNATAIHWDGVTWRVQVAGLTGPNAGTLNSVFMVSPTDVWAVGQDLAGTAGTIWHWTGVPGLGGGWNLVQTVPHTLRSVFMVSATEGWTVGDTGVIFHYFAGAWTAFSSPFPGCVGPFFQCGLNSVFMLSPTDGWAVGTSGVILHYTAGTWAGPVSPGTTLNALFSVFMISSTEGWAVGGGLSQDNATIVHYDGGTWTALPINLIPLSPFNQFSLNSVFFTTAADGWAVGTAGVIAHFDGSNWGTLTSPSLNNFTSVNFGPPLTGPINPNDGWIVGNVSTAKPFEPTIFHWNGFMWTKGVAIGATNNLNSVFMISSGDVWSVGGGPHFTASCTATPVALCPIILHFMGGSWNTVTPPPGAYTLKSVFMVGPNEGWAVGEQAGAPPSGIILHYTVTGGVGTWAIFPAPSSPGPTAPLNSVFMLNPNEGWAVGDNATMLHYTVTGGVGTWNVVTVSGSPSLSTDANLTSIFMLSPQSGWAVGGIQQTGSFSAGPVILYWDGTKWTPVATPTIPGDHSPRGHTSATLKTIFCSGANNCWAAGNPGKLFATLFHWDGIAWNFVATSPALLGEVPPILTSIYLTDPDSGWIVGSDPEFPSALAQSFGGTEALSTILRSAPLVLTGTSTTTIVSTVTSSTTFLTVSFISTSTIVTSTTSTNTTIITPPAGPSGNIIPVIIGIIAALAIALLLILLLIGRRRPRPRPVIMYPIQRRPC
jgi:hypothetical protein